ncbi:MAG: hypothetical protein ACPGUF_03965, partial [Litorivicinus sp.]
KTTCVLGGGLTDPVQREASEKAKLRLMWRERFVWLAVEPIEMKILRKAWCFVRVCDQQKR